MKFGGFGGGQNMQQLMKQAQKMQQDALRAQEEIEQTQIEGSASGGMVKVVINGKKKPISVSIAPELLEDQDNEMLEDLVLAAMMDASNKADKLSADKMGMFGGLM